MRRTLRLLALFTLATAAVLAIPVVAHAEPAVAMNGGGQLYFFDTASPATNTTRAIANPPGPTVVAMDLRPANGDLYAFTAADPAGADNTMLQLWRIDLETAVATTVGAPIGPFVDSGFWGMDFNPVADRIRLTEGQNKKSYRVNPNDGLLLSTDADLSAVGVADVAYDRNIAGTAATTAFAVTYNDDKLYRLGGVDGSPSPNGGVLTEIGPLGVDLTNAMRFDISPTSGVAYVTHVFNLYTVNLTTGALTSMGPMPFNPSNGIAFLGSSTMSLDAAAQSVEEGSSAAVTVTRTGVTNRPTTIGYNTSSDTATASADYVVTGGTITFAAGETSHTIYIPIVRDAVNDPNEKFTVVIGGAVSGDVGSITTQTVTITQETTKPTVLALPLLPRTFALARKLGITARFSVSEASTTTATLKLGTKLFGTGGAPVATTGASVRSAKATLTPRGKLLVAAALKASKLGRVPLTLTLTTTDTSGNVKVTTARVIVTR